MRVIYVPIKSPISNQVRKDRRVNILEIKLESVKEGSHITCVLQTAEFDFNSAASQERLASTKSWGPADFSGVCVCSH